MDVAIIEREALLLPEGERALLADRLLQTLGSKDTSVMDAWAAEADRRFQSLQKGESLIVDGPDAVEKIRQSL